jgi:hypothetical protein
MSYTTHIHVTRIAAMHIIFTRIGCTLLTCDMYMCRVRHRYDPVLSSLKMEGIRLLFIQLWFRRCGGLLLHLQPTFQSVSIYSIQSFFCFITASIPVKGVSMLTNRDASNRVMTSQSVGAGY